MNNLVPIASTLFNCFTKVEHVMLFSVNPVEFSVGTCSHINKGTSFRCSENSANVKMHGSI